MSELETGTVRFCDENGGFGSLAPDTGGEDVYVGDNARIEAGIGKLNKGDRVEFERRQTRRGDRAYSLHLLSAARQ